MKVTFSILLVLVMVGCLPSRQVAEHSSQERNFRIDSLRDITSVELVPVTVPRSLAQIALSSDEIDRLPLRAVYEQSSGRARAVVEKVGTQIVFTAECDSVTMVLEHVTRELDRYRLEVDSLRTDSMTKEQVIVREPTGWQWFQIHGFRVLLGVCLLFISFKKLQGWRKITSL